MAYYEQLPVGEITFSNKTAIGSGTPTIEAGDMTSLATLFAEVPSTLSIGSTYLATTGKIYLKVANAGASSDWERVTTTAAD